MEMKKLLQGMGAAFLFALGIIVLAVLFFKTLSYCFSTSLPPRDTKQMGCHCAYGCACKSDSCNASKCCDCNCTTLHKCTANCSCGHGCYCTAYCRCPGGACKCRNGDRCDTRCRCEPKPAKKTGDLP